MHVRWYGPQALRPRPDRFRQRCIVVARDQDPRAGEAAQCCEQATDHPVADRLGVEHVARDEDCVNSAICRECRDFLDDEGARLGQQCGVVRIEMGVAPANLPVGRVQEARHVVLRGLLDGKDEAS